MAFSSILLIYNPHASSGRAEAKAKELARTLKRKGLISELVPTKHAGHAEELAYARACTPGTPLIVSVSGDGGYNEVVNGVMRAIDDGKANTPVCAVYPAGHANDHGKTVQYTRLTTGIVRGNVEHINILQLTVKSGSETFMRYAHSYTGFDFSGQMGHLIDDYRGSRLAQTNLVLRSLKAMEPVKVILDGRELLADVFVCANIGRMAKVLKLAKDTDMHDGRFNLIVVEHNADTPLLKELFKMTLAGFDSPQAMEKISFTLPDATRIQYDGEAHSLPAGSQVTVHSLKNGLATIR